MKKIKQTPLGTLATTAIALCIAVPLCTHWENKRMARRRAECGLEQTVSEFPSNSTMPATNPLIPTASEIYESQMPTNQYMGTSTLEPTTKKEMPQSLKQQIEKTLRELPEPIEYKPDQKDSIKEKKQEEPPLMQYNTEQLASSSPITRELIKSLIYAESTNRPREVSQRGARGLMQIMSQTWKQESAKVYGKELPFSLAYDPTTNRNVGMRYLITLNQYLSKQCPGYNSMSKYEQQSLIIAAYNFGPTALKEKKFNISRTPKETRNHVRKVMSNL